MENSNLWMNNDRHVTKVFKALSDGTRQQILHLLEGEERSVGEIVRYFSLSQPTISRHLSVLREAELVVDQRQGQRVLYSLNGEVLSLSMQQFFGRFSGCQDALRNNRTSGGDGKSRDESQVPLFRRPVGV